MGVQTFWLWRSGVKAGKIMNPSKKNKKLLKLRTFVFYELAEIKFM